MINVFLTISLTFTITLTTVFKTMPSLPFSMTQSSGLPDSANQKNNSFRTLTNYFELPSDSNVESMCGRLQNTKHSTDSIMGLGFKESYDSLKPYEIIFLYKTVKKRVELGEDSICKIFSCKEQMLKGFSDFDCYAFIYPHLDPTELEEGDDNEIIFPVFVKSYKRVDKSNWAFRGSSKVNSYEELDEFEFKTIYNL